MRNLCLFANKRGTAHNDSSNRIYYFCTDGFLARLFVIVNVKSNSDIQYNGRQPTATDLALVALHSIAVCCFFVF